MHVDVAHDISGEIEFTIKEKINGVSDVIVHIEPLHKQNDKITQSFNK